MIIDAHNHFIPDVLIDFMRKRSNDINTEIIKKDGREFINHFEGFSYPLFPEFFDYDSKVSHMKKAGLDKVILSVAPTVFYYWIKKEAAVSVAKLCNDWVADFINKHPKQFGGMATLPMQDIEESLKELERAHNKLGLKAVEIAPVILGKNLDEEEFLPIFEMAEKYNILVYLHPYYVGVKQPYNKYYHTNTMGNPIETALGISHLIFGGIFEKYPGLKILTSHGGGYFPYQLGRLIHAYNVRPEPKVNISKPPEQYLKNIYYDTITHWAPAIEFLIKNFGADKVVIGTDYPYDMGDLNPMDILDKIALTVEEREKIQQGNITELLGG